MKDILLIRYCARCEKVTAIEYINYDWAFKPCENPVSGDRWLVHRDRWVRVPVGLLVVLDEVAA